MKKYGVKNALLCETTKRKIAKSNKDNFGKTNPFNKKFFQDKVKNTWERKYGSSHFWLSTVGKRVLQEFKDGKRRRSSPFSLESLNFFKKLEERLKVKCFYGEEEKSFITEDGKSIKVDCFIPSLNVSIEFMGDYWHFNPKMDWSSKASKEKIDARRKKDSSRYVDEVISTNSNVIWVWEKDFLQNEQKCLEGTIKMIKKLNRS